MPRAFAIALTEQSPAPVRTGFGSYSTQGIVFTVHLIKPEEIIVEEKHINIVIIAFQEEHLLSENRVTKKTAARNQSNDCLVA
jgi:hypothetical protein